jgi:hypothetical protein
MILRPYALGLLLFLASPACAQMHSTHSAVDLGLVLCWNNTTEKQLSHDQRLLQAVGRAIALEGTAKTIGVRADSCGRNMPGDAACYTVPKVVICQAVVIERVLRAAAWTTSQHAASGSTSYEQFRRTYPESVAYGFQYADNARDDPSATALLENPSSAPVEEQERMAVLVDYALATLIGHEITHANDNACPIITKSLAEDTGLLTKIVQDELRGEIFAKHSAAPEEIAGDRCALRYLRALYQHLSKKLDNEDPSTIDFLVRSAADMVVFQSTFGWRRYEQLPNGKYAIFSLDSYLYAPYRGLLFASEIRGSLTKPVICGYASEMLVQAIQTTFKTRPGKGNVDDPLLAYFAKGVEASWNGAPWTPNSFACSALN